LNDQLELNSLLKSNQLDSIVKSLLNDGNELDVQLARSIAERILTDPEKRDMKELLQRIESVISFLHYEHSILFDKYRYKSDKQRVTEDSVYIRVT